LDEATQQHGLATTGGLIPTTGIAGFSLGGGLGHLMRSCGLACDNLLSAEVVTADGNRLRVDAEHHPDLFWALRGGGGNFGVVTEFEFRLHEVGPVLLGGRIAHSLADARDALRFYRDFCETAPDSLIVYAGLATGPDGAPRLGWRAVVNGPVDGADQLVAPLRAYGTPVLDDIRPQSYVEIQRIVEPMFPRGRQNYWKASFVDELSDELIDVLVEAMQRVPSPYTIIAIEQMGGAMARLPDTATAFQHRKHAFSLLILSGWEDPADTDANVAWTRQLWEDTRPLASSAVYVNYLGTEGDQRVRDAFGVNHERLARVKAQYDPGNLFRLNQNIRPARAVGSRQAAQRKI
jgi:FAD/FMN-containing dehydrogenase